MGLVTFVVVALYATTVLGDVVSNRKSAELNL